MPRGVPIDVGEEAELELDPFGRRLDDEVRPIERLADAGRHGHPPQSGVCVAGADLSAIDTGLEDAGDRVSRALELSCRHVIEARFEAGRRGRMGDAVPHGSGTQHGHGPYIHRDP